MKDYENILHYIIFNNTVYTESIYRIYYIIYTYSILLDDKLLIYSK